MTGLTPSAGHRLVRASTANLTGPSDEAGARAINLSWLDELRLVYATPRLPVRVFALTPPTPLAREGLAFVEAWERRLGHGRAQKIAEWLPALAYLKD